MRSFGERIKEQRHALGLSLQNISRKIHYSQEQISKYEREVRCPSTERGMSFVVKLAQALDMEEDPLYYALGRLPPDVLDQDVSDDCICRAMDAFRAVIAEENDFIYSFEIK